MVVVKPTPRNRKERRAESGRPQPSAPFPDRWRAAIAQQLMEGHPPQNIIQGLVNAGATRPVATAEVRAAQAHPYLRGVTTLGARLRKRDWLLDLYAAHWRLGAGETPTIERRAGVSTEEFRDEYYAAHRPVIVTDVIDAWPAMTKWSLDYFEEVAGDAEIEVQFGRDRSPDYEHKRQNFVRVMPFRELLDLLRSDEKTNNYYVTANNSGKNRQALAPLWNDIIQVPQYLERNDHADGFFWLGPRGTITPYHHDLTNNLLVQVFGRKRVRLVPSYETRLMRNWTHVYSRWTGEDLAVGPADGDKPTVIETILGPGEAMFIPIGWWHWVEGLDVTAGMSFTNFKWRNDFFKTYSSYNDV